MLRQKQKDGLIWYEFALFEAYPELKHGFFTRHGGVSGPTGTDLHLAFNGYDTPERVRQNIGRAEQVVGLPPAAFVRQTHSANIAVVRPGDDYHPQEAGEALDDFDALVAPEPGPSLMIKTADCQGVVIYDPATKILGLVHSGWRGSVKNIIGLTVAEMKKLGADPASSLAGVGPSLGPCCAEFQNHQRELPEEFGPFEVSENHFDFWAVSRRQLTQAGLKPENVATAGLCTKCDSDFFSYRRGDRLARGGVLAGVVI